MRVLRHIAEATDGLRGGAVAIGNFDGVHRGHQALIGRCGAMARQSGGPLVALTFEPHPRSIFQPDAPPFRMTPFRSKARLLAELGVDYLVALRFDHHISRKPAVEFVEDFLVRGLGARHVVVGYDFVFGHRRSGDAGVLAECGRQHGFEVTVLEPVVHDDDVCSSTIIRIDLETGRTRRAAELLGHWWEIEGRVRGGDKRGRQLGFPTANLHLKTAALRPALGVYAIRFGLDEGGETRWYPGVANLGQRPTFDGQGVILEAHLFDFSADIYGRHGRVAFVDHLRPERKFNGIDEIKAQIGRDCEQARAVLADPANALDHFAMRPTPLRGAGG
ncbi:MAG: bifunctional riboflavin kinase/FAD synthetase [Alphaproteobacteria bacterium]|jgi:riboflavin kinase/FMN adenylyltransferase|nr:bifunctional riboflavin kinase/FAD synthetase [Alphaproteobacteria bacterium]MDP6567844.1 bifunctional riboflavin kinase/FAD synthetase [Alphaproteobacteria bacterium]MDP6813368.1 bifunctional riboflavin kinase/FAD synthetase [Alphaproteobacteria bacterium]